MEPVLLRMDSNDKSMTRRARYTPPASVTTIRLNELLKYTERPFSETQASLFRDQPDTDHEIYYSGDLTLLKGKCVCVIGARSVSEAGRARARRVARELSDAGVVVTSGLAKGVDISAHLGAMGAGGNTIAVIGTPINKAYPIEHAEVQEEIYSDHLLISQFRPGQRTFPSDFPKRNKLMAALTDASVIVEASDTSGTLHQATECVRLGRWLFIMRSVAENPDLQWPQKFLKEPKVKVLSDVGDILSAIG
ncbi:DNA-processing protein DprA [Nitratireductor sp. B36]|uniref:DNA-processing protein DprA n=1 Tax=Nitratireductor sp. B36 TaxID=2762059 RepID=UPI001E33004C|nr:DNA-processing protein DprA [Nitratireductor sp. B36]MCC5777888.1 DNA-processing protein DprA [Nitratireductor sp. B36]